MRAIIIAAGLGSRLKPYTNNLPKILVKIGNTNILESQLKVFKSLNIRDINLIVGHKKEQFETKKIKYLILIKYLIVQCQKRWKILKRIIIIILKKLM